MKTAPHPEAAARTIARATTIVGLMLEGIADQRNVQTRVPRQIIRLGRWMWALVELAAPRSLGHILFNHWIAVG